jgi:hypothetical protein
MIRNPGWGEPGDPQVNHYQPQSAGGADLTGESLEADKGSSYSTLAEEVTENLDQLYGGCGSRSDLQRAANLLENQFNGVKTFSSWLSKRADDFYEEQGLFVLWNFNLDESRLEVAAYCDGENYLVSPGDYWEIWEDITALKDMSAPQGMNLVEEMPDCFDDYHIDLPEHEYTKLRKGWVIGPGTFSMHDEFSEDEFDQSPW